MNQSVGNNATPTQKIKSAAPNIFNFEFPIWNEQYRPILEEKILKHYYMWEIGLETIGLWKFYLDMRLNEIMPYYNQLYATTTKDFDWGVDVDVVENLDRTEKRSEGADYEASQTNKTTLTESNDTDTTDDTTSNTTTDTSGTSKTTGNPTSHTMHNDFPQAPIETSDYATYEDYTQNVLSEDVVTDGMDSTDATVNVKRTTNQDIDSTTNSTQGITSTNQVDSNATTGQNVVRKGLSGTRSMTELMVQYRDALLNIDMMIIDNLGDLFMSIY